MSTIVTRAGKGSPLTHVEVDANFTNLNTDKVEKTAAAITGGTINGTTIGATTPSTVNATTITGQTGVLRGTGQNLVQYSEQIDNAYWSKSNVTVTADATTSPTGTTTADLIYPSSTGLNRVFFRSALTTGLTYTSSIYAKASGLNFIYFAVETGAGVGAVWFNLSTGAVGTTIAGYTASISSVGSGWYRCSVTRTASGGFLIWGISDADNTTTATTSATNGVYVWGTQLEFASSVGTYVQTVASTIYGTPTLSFSGVSEIGLLSNGALYLQPAGTGALQAQATTSTTAGGNARGANAVDWQTIRGSAGQVAGNQYSVLSGGVSNTASGVASVVSGGFSNNNIAAYAVIAGGQSNTQSSNFAGTYSVISGGFTNSANGYYNVISGGFTNSGTSGSAVTTQSGTMNATTAVTLSGSNASIKVGQYISGTSIANDTYVAAISGTALTLSKVASGSSTSTLSFFTPHGVVVGGGNNQATGSYSFIGGGGDAGTAANRNVASGAWSAVVGGIKNTASGLGSFIGGGGTDGSGFFANIASGVSSVIVGGTNNSNSGTTAFIGAGVTNAITASYGFIGAGAQNLVNSQFGGIIAGFNGTTRAIEGNHVFPACNNPIANAIGVQQSSLLVLGVQTTDATATALRSNTSAAGTTNQVILPNNSAYFFTGEVISGVTGGGNTKGWTIEGVIKRGANAASTALVGTPTVTSSFADAGASTWTIAVTADTTNGGLAVTFTGQASTTIRTVAQIRTTEMTY
jgi:hypothetical protein